MRTDESNVNVSRDWRLRDVRETELHRGGAGRDAQATLDRR